MIAYAIVSLRQFSFWNAILKILPLAFLLFCHNIPWASPIEPTKGSSAYIIKADGSLALINEDSRSKDGFEVSGDSLGIMLTDIMADDIKHPIFKIGVKVGDPLVFMHVWYSLGDSNKYNIGEPIYLYGDGKYHQYNIDFMAHNVHGQRIKTLYLYFGNSINDISIRDISLYNHSGSFSDTLSIALESFLRTKLIERANVNSIVSPRVFNLSLIASLNILAIILLIAAAGYYFWRWKKYKETSLVRKIIISLLAILMFLWVIADVRMIYNELYHIKLTWQGYLKPQNNNDSYFYDFKGYYEFLSSIKGNMSAEVKAATFYMPPNYIYILMAKYYLYPITVTDQKEEELFKVFYKYPFAEIREDKLYYMSMDGKSVSGETGRVIKKYSGDTFIFFKAKNE